MKHSHEDEEENKAEVTEAGERSKGPEIESQDNEYGQNDDVAVIPENILNDEQK